MSTDVKTVKFVNAYLNNMNVCTNIMEKYLFSNISFHYNHITISKNKHTRMNNNLLLTEWKYRLRRTFDVPSV